MMHLLMFTFQFGALVLGYTHAIPELSSLRSQFKKNFRLERKTCYNLIEDFKNSVHFPKNETHGGSTPISAEKHVLSFLWFSGNKSCIRDVASRFGIGESSFHRAMHRVINYLLSISPDIIKFPKTTEEKENIAAEFEKAGSSESFWQPSNNDIYIDDEELQGSGHSQGEVKDALEESSGSGAGPWPANVKGDRDDEDDEDGGSSSSFKPQLKLTRKSNLEHQKPNITVGVEQPSTGRNNGPSTPKTDVDKQPSDAGVIMNIKDIDVRTTSFFAQPGILEAFIGGAVVGLLCAILVVMFIVYRMRKKDEGSYALDELKRLPTVNSTRKTQTVNSSPESSPKFSNTVAL